MLTPSLNTLSSVNVLLGDRGDEPHPADPGVHLHVSGDNQREGEGGTEDVLCEHGNVKVPFPEQLGLLKSHLRFGKKTVFLGRYHALSDCHFCPSCLMCVLCSVPGASADSSLCPEAHRSVRQDRSATCTVLTPKEEEKGCVT